MKTNYSEDEKELLDAIASGEFTSMDKQKQKTYQAYAANALKKDIRLRDIQKGPF